eukprot:706688-Pyramimonas_sp.AAC.2
MRGYMPYDPVEFLQGALVPISASPQGHQLDSLLKTNHSSQKGVCQADPATLQQQPAVGENSKAAVY